MQTKLNLMQLKPVVGSSYALWPGNGLDLFAAPRAQMRPDRITTINTAVT